MLQMANIYVCCTEKGAFSKIWGLFVPCRHMCIDKIAPLLDKFGLEGLNLAIFTKNSKVLKF